MIMDLPTTLAKKSQSFVAKMVETAIYRQIAEDIDKFRIKRRQNLDQVLALLFV